MSAFNDEQEEILRRDTITNWQWSDRSSATSAIATILSKCPNNERAIIVIEALEAAQRSNA